MKAIVTGGWSNKIGDKAPIWSHADALEKLAGVTSVERHTEQDDFRASLTAQRANGEKLLVVVYSYGCADLFDLLAKIAAAGQIDRVHIDFLIIVAGVNDAWILGRNQKWEDCWEAPACVDRAIALCTVYRAWAATVIPECAPLRMRNYAGVLIIAPSWNPDESRTITSHSDLLNVNVFEAGIDHGSIVTHARTGEIVLRAAVKLIEEEREAA